MTFTKALESRRNILKTEKSISLVRGAAIRMLLHRWNIASNGGGVNFRTSRTIPGEKVCSRNRHTDRLRTL